jgi:poly(hydroxyalkanoate) depolymerase family esterase
MKPMFGAAIEEALRLTRDQNLSEATRVLIRGLSGVGEVRAEEPAPQAARWIEPPTTLPGAEAQATSRLRLPLGETLAQLRKGGLPDFGQGLEALAKVQKRPRVIVPAGASYLSRIFACQAGSRSYKVYLPSGARSGKLPLVVMLHGCTQNADDFAVGTRMNHVAEERGFIVAYPEQPMSANQMGCWNWFNPQDQLRDQGEPSIIAGLTRVLISEMNIDRELVFIAGLSAGGAMAEVMSATYPDLYAGAGVHSGVAYGVASDAASAFVAMSGKSTQRRARRGNERIRTIIFHGGSDQKVHPTNAELILAEARAGFSRFHKETQQRGIAKGRNYCRTVVTAGGVPQVEYWEIEGLGHAWSGGSPEGSHSDRHGPDASREMLRFFLEGSTER